MKYTNNLNLSQPLFDAIVAENEKEHTPADYSVTQLLKGAAEIALTMLHEDELVVDVSDLLNPLFGSAVHSILEKAGNQETSELYLETKILDKYLVSGTIDNAEDDCTTDYKTCSSWKITYQDYDDWRNQIKGYNYLRLAVTGKLILKGKVEAMIKDWSPTNAERDPSYPQSPVVVINFTYTEDEITKVPYEWVKKIEDAEFIKCTKVFIPCSDEERWHEPDKWALMKPGRKSAIKLFDNEADAESAKTEKSMYVEHRVGKDKKCDRYCIVGRCGFCPYYNETHKEENDETVQTA